MGVVSLRRQGTDISSCSTFILRSLEGNDSFSLYWLHIGLGAMNRRFKGFALRFKSAMQRGEAVVVIGKYG